MALLQLLKAAVGLYTAWSVLCFLRNYLAARKSGFPLLLFPFNPTNPLFQALSHSGILSLKVAERCPRFLWRYLRYCHAHAGHQELFRPYDPPEPAVLIVSPGGCVLHLQDPGVSDLVLARRRDFLVYDLTRSKFRIRLQVGGLL